jgi:hypothetical protein
MRGLSVMVQHDLPDAQGGFSMIHDPISTDRAPVGEVDRYFGGFEAQPAGDAHRPET